MLKVANIDIARRTVTKYREALNLLSSTKRRQVG
jgi:DNA-directed RNA polymerase specialized sigma54-like protein